MIYLLSALLPNGTITPWITGTYPLLANFSLDSFFFTTAGSQVNIGGAA